MIGTADNEGLTLGYRFMWRLRYVGMQVFGPAKLEEDRDPQRRLLRERAAKVEAAKASRLGAHDREHG